jgi:glycosyltransferase involved in cell wall biosynthesis
MKICFVSPGLYYSDVQIFNQLGLESELLGLAMQMSKKGHEVFITGRFKNFEGESRVIDNIKFVNIKIPNFRDERLHEIGSAILYSKRVANVIKKLDVDILSLNERFSAIYPAKLEIPKTFTTHNPDAMDFYKKFAINHNLINLLFFDVKNRFEERIFLNSEEIIALNSHIENYLNMKGFINTSVIPNAIDPDKYSDNGNENFILYAGRLNQVKGIKYLIDAFSQLESDHTLLLIGSGPEEQKLKSMLNSELAERIIFISHVNKTKLIDYMSKCAFLVLPSLFETFGVVLIEAMASGKPVIASDIPGPNDIIENGYNGFLFEKGNVDQLKNFLKILIENDSLRKRMGINARKTVENKYTFQKISEEYLKVFNKLLSN